MGLLVSGAVGCLGGELDPYGAPSEDWDFRYVQDGVVLPTGSAATSQAVDLDGNGTPDNKLGSVLGALSNFGLDLQTKADEMIQDGNVIVLHGLTAQDLMSDSGARWQVLLGEATDSPDFSGQGSFTVAENSPRDAVLDGEIDQGRFEGGPAPVAVYFAIGDVAITFHLVQAVLEGTVTEQSGELHFAGGIMDTEIENQLVPAAAQLINDFAADHPDSATGMMDLLDLDADGRVTPDELKMNTLVADLLEPDLDLAGGDGQPDALSMALGVRLVRATF